MKIQHGDHTNKTCIAHCILRRYSDLACVEIPVYPVMLELKYKWTLSKDICISRIAANIAIWQTNLKTIC